MSKDDTITIVGAGMAGLLAANLLQTDQRIRVVEAQKTLPNNHSAVLRFRSSIIGDKLGIPFREVTMIKDVVPWKNPVADALSYSFKNTGIHRSDRSIIGGRVVDKRYIAPSNFIELMEQKALRRRVTFEYGHYWQPDDTGRPVISTLPMPVLGTVLKWPERSGFYSTEALSITAKVRDCDAFVTLMFPDPARGFSRASITGNQLIVEVPRYNFEAGGGKMANVLTETIANDAASFFGFLPGDLTEIQSHRQRYAKIIPTDDNKRKDFIYGATHGHNVYSLGRFATWRPWLLLDDLVKDIELINRWINSSSRYAVAKHRG